MYDDCIQNFLNKTHPSSAEQHSDSSDFEIPSKYFRVAAKIAIHTSKAKNINSELIKEHTQLCNAHINTEHRMNSENSFLDNMIKYVGRGKQIEEKKDGNVSNSEAHKNHIKRSHGNIDIIRDLNNINDETCKPEKLMSSSTETDDLISSKSNSKNNTLTNSDDIDKFKLCKSQADSKTNTERKKHDKLFWHHKKLKKVGNDKESYTIRPIYIIERKEHNAKKGKNEEENSSHDFPVFCSSCCSISFAESEKEIFKRSYRILSSTVSKQNEPPNKSIHVENNSNTSDSIKSPQYPLKRNVSTPCHMSPIYESKSVATDPKITNKLTSSSSAFWNFLSDKVHRKYSKRKDYRNKYSCDAFNISCHQDIFENTTSVDKQKSTVETPSPEANNYINKINQTEFLRKDTDCQCNYGSTKLEVLSEIKSRDRKETSQQRHEAIAKALSDKYNGEILCIHNPPCVLINGCLNMCPSKSGHSQFWPIMAKRKVAFGHKIKKEKPSKSSKNDQSSQYQPSFSKLEECLPEFKVESMQKKRSPCQVFQCGAQSFKIKKSTHESKFDSLNIIKDVNSVSSKNSDNKKIPVCSKVYVVVNANDSNSNSTKAICPHNPQCLMVPKCLVRLISDNYVQVKSVPDCTHVPYCEKIPACYGKAMKEAARSERSKSPCRIV